MMLPYFYTRRLSATHRMKKRSPQQTGSVFLCLKSDLDHIPTGTIFTDAILAKNEKQLIEQVKAQTEDVFHLY